ncbi:MAG TPA: SBBP repeat-containing protein [Pyrinomonadaceae bacterium]|nr:SBBP repeat-containing protein [Pyrinomonadaceae bacterium]HMP65592.1 SBBP repeat-containing protein [Pyrinomonadaceae bacterium]
MKSLTNKMHSVAHLCTRRFIQILLLSGVVLGGDLTFTFFSFQVSGQLKPTEQDIERRLPVMNNHSLNPAKKLDVSNYKSQPSFEPNVGQTDKTVKFLGKGFGYELFLTANEAVMVFGKKKKLEHKDSRPLLNDKKKISREMENYVLRMEFIGANPRPHISSHGSPPGKRNYLFDKKITNVPTFNKVTYSNLYDGIDVEFYSNQSFLEYDFIVAPHVDVSIIRLKFERADTLKVDSNGDLVLFINGNEIRHKKPYIYQEIAGIKKEVKGGYTINGLREVGFRVEKYNNSMPLVIDPVLIYSTYLGGVADDRAVAITADKKGNAYVTGFTRSSNFPKTTNPVTTSPPSTTDTQLFISKFDATGGHIFSTYWGGSANDESADIVIDSAENIYIAGHTESSDYPTTSGAFQETPSSSWTQGFITKLNSSGTDFVYSTYLGGSSGANVKAIDIDGSESLFITGFTMSEDFPTTSGAFQTTLQGHFSSFVTKLNTSGSALIYSTYLGGETSPKELLGSIGMSISVNNDGNAFITGFADTLDFPSPTGFPPHTNNGQSDVFAAQLNSNGTALVYSKLIGGSGTDEAYDGKLDSEGNFYITGVTNSTNFPTTSGAFQTTNGGQYDAFIVKIDPSGAMLVFSTYLGGSGIDGTQAINIDSDGSIFVFGDTNSSNFPTTPDSFPTNSLLSGFVTKLNATGSILVYSTRFPAGVLDGFLSSCGDILLTGVWHDVVEFLPVRSAFQETPQGLPDGFITKLSFLSTQGTATDASEDGPFTTTVSEYKLPAEVDVEVLDWQYNHPIDGIQPLQVELWASVYRPTTLTGPHPLIVMLHGNHGVCERNSTPEPPPPLPSGVNIKEQFYPEPLSYPLFLLPI